MEKITILLLLLSPASHASTTLYYQGKAVSKVQALKIAVNKPSAVFAKITGNAVALNPNTLRFKKTNDLTPAEIKALISK